MRSRVVRNLLEMPGRLPLLGPLVRAASRSAFNAAASSNGSTRLFFGTFPSFAAAERAIPAGRSIGHDDPAWAERMMPEWLCVFASDYPAMFWLEKLLRECDSVFDWGGNVGIKYFAFRTRLAYPERLVWYVNDVPAVLRRGEEIARREFATSLRFTPTMDALADAGILLASGVVQFIEEPFARLCEAKKLPDHLIFNKVPVLEGASTITLHNIGTALCPYHIFNRANFVARIEELGFRLRDTWTTPEIDAHIPFSPEFDVGAYSGFYFSRTAEPHASPLPPLRGMRFEEVEEPYGL